jgi:hypothetical protein
MTAKEFIDLLILLPKNTPIKIKYKYENYDGFHTPTIALSLGMLIDGKGCLVIDMEKSPDYRGDGGAL